MVGLRKLLSLAIAACMLVAGIPLSALAAETDELVLIRVSNGNSEKIYQAVSRDSELYFPAEAYGEMTKYAFTASENYGYQLGDKTIVIEPKSGDMEIPAQNYAGNIGSGISIDGVDYLPASKLLPWMNVSCDVDDDGVLTVVPDAMSMWEVLNGFDYASYLFSVYDVYGESTSSAVGLGSMVVFDTIINFRWDRLVPVGEEGSLYDYECYVSALSELGQIDCIDVADNRVSGESELISFAEALGIGEGESAEDLEGALRGEGLNEATIQEITKVGDSWDALKGCANVSGLVTDYADVFAALKTYGLILTTNNDYRDYLTWLSERGTGNSLFDCALAASRATLDENRGVAFTLASEFCKGLLSALPEGVFEAVLDGATDEAVEEAFEECSNGTGFMGTLKQYTAISKIIYGALFEDAVAGYEGMAKAGVLESIQDYCWDLAGSLRYEELTEETVMHIRQSYLTALQASKQLFQAQQGTMNFGILADMGLLENGDDLLDSQIQLIDGKSKQLIASSDAALNDSVDGKEEYTVKLGEMFSGVKRFPAVEPVVIDLSWTGMYDNGELMRLYPGVSGVYDDGTVLCLYADQAILQTPEGEDISFGFDKPICYNDVPVAQVQCDASKAGNVQVYLYRYDGIFNFEVEDDGYADHIADSYIQNSGVTAAVKTPSRDDVVTYDLESGLYRGRTGVWFWAPFSLDHGELSEYDESLVLAGSQGGAGVSAVGKLADGEYPISCDGESLFASNGDLYLTFSYYEHRYHDAQDILSLQPGDMANYQGEEVLVEDVETYSWEKDGKTMYGVWANDYSLGWTSDEADPGRMMEVFPDNEDPVYIEIGSLTLKVSEHACLYDEAGNSMPQWDAKEVSYDNLLQHFAEYFSDPYSGGDPATTTITVRDGEISTIYRKWHP